MMRFSFNNKFLLFFGWNYVTVTLFEIALIQMFNGRGNPFPSKQVLIMLAISLPIVLAQYPILRLYKNWWYRSFVFYSSMLLFLCSYGLVSSWDVSGGGFEAGTWDARLHGMNAIVFIGHLIGWLPLMIIIVINRATVGVFLDMQSAKTPLINE